MAGPRHGVYDFSWSGGTFQVEIRADGAFWCRKFAVDSTWELKDDGRTVYIDWRKYGKYDLVINDDGSLAGSVQGKPDDWRKAAFVRAFSPAELLLSGSSWMLSYEGGKPFGVEFHADGHFHSPNYPGHFLWTLDENKVAVNWGKYGSYDFDLDVEGRAMSGHVRGNPDSWRKLEYVEALPAYIKKEHSCGHAH